jgi:hypothetical protein
MKVKDMNGRELEVRVQGQEPEDLSLYDVYYTDIPGDPVTAEVIDYVVTKYADELMDEWLNNYGYAGEAYYELREDF